MRAGTPLRRRVTFKVESVPELLERLGLRIGEELSGGWKR